MTISIEHFRHARTPVPGDLVLWVNNPDKPEIYLVLKLTEHPNGDYDPIQYIFFLAWRLDTGEKTEPWFTPHNAHAWRFSNPEQLETLETKFLTYLSFLIE